jgi:fatty-acyl-CoA synthase
VLNRIASEYAYLTGALRTLSKVKPLAKHPTRTVGDLVEDLAGRFGDKPAFVSDREEMSYVQYDRRANQYARWAMTHDVKKGDTIALLMPNRPEYFAVWLGIARAGGVTALLNTNLTGAALAHCINIVAPKHIIVDAQLADSYAGAEPHLKCAPALWRYGAVEAGSEDEPATEKWRDLVEALAAVPSGRIPPEARPALTIDDHCLYIYTSGTTGLPKAANINHYRVQGIMLAFQGAMKMTERDRIYVCLPLYHTSGGVLASGAALTAGGTVILRERFSARTFWDDVVDNDCTVFEYVGELCRYLLNSPPHPKEKQHKLRLACGNGLRPDIWEDFKTRFRIPRILEWYAATEGNAVYFNFDGKVGAVGRIPKWAERRFVSEVIRLDIETEEPVRGPNGFCIKCGPEEVGEAISQIVIDPMKPSQRFDGYADRAATEKKILKDVFKTGDRWFRTGDLMRKDALGYFYFVDRIGDTFRWKGENVATSEVSETLTGAPGVQEANVYGVKVPGTEGRVCMAALVTEGDLDLEGLRKHVMNHLPPYARPRFVRVKREIDATSTFKQRKADLVKEAFDPAAIADPIYFLEPGTNTYVRLKPTIHSDILEGRVRL